MKPSIGPFLRPQASFEPCHPFQVVPLPWTFDAVPLATVTPAALKPFTLSLNVTVNGIGLVFVGSGAVVVTVAVGAVRRGGHHHSGDRQPPP